MAHVTKQVLSAGLLTLSVALLCSTASAYYSDECGDTVQASSSDVTKVAGLLLSPYIQVNGPHSGNVVRHSIWTAITLENWLTSSRSDRYFAAGLNQLSMEDKKMIVFAGIIHDLAKGGFPSCSYHEHERSRMLEVKGHSGQSGTGNHPEAGAHMVAGRLPFLVYKEFFKKSAFAKLEDGGWIVPIGHDDKQQVMKWFEARWPDKRHACFGRWGDAFGKTVYKLNMDKYIEAAGLTTRRAEIQLLVGTHWGFGPVNSSGFVKMSLDSVDHSSSGALFFLDTFERNIREAGLLERVSANPQLKGKLGELCALISYADVMGQSEATVHNTSPSHLELFDLVTCPADPDRPDRRAYYRYGLETDVSTEKDPTILPARRNYEILMAILGANSVVDYVTEAGVSGRENVEYFQFWSQRFSQFLGGAKHDSAPTSAPATVNAYLGVLDAIESEL